MRDAEEKRRPSRIRPIALALALAGLVLFPAAYNISGTGAAWTTTLTVASLSGGAGTDFSGPITSGAAQYVIDIGGGPGSKTWQIDVKRTDTLWNPGVLTLSVRRTSDGTGSGSIAGGTSYQAVTTSDASFFTGQDTRTGINMQYQISGATVTLGVNNFSTTVTYTITTN